MLSKPAQFATIKTAIVAEPSLATAATVTTTTNPENGEVTKRVSDPQDVADFFNADHASLRIWRRNVLPDEIFGAIVWTELVARSVGERDTLKMMLDRGRIDFNLANIRTGFQDIFSGAGGASSRQAIVAVGKRRATKAEALFADFTAPNDGTAATPGILGLEGPLTATDVETALTR